MPNSAFLPIAAVSSIGCIFFAVFFMRAYKQSSFAKAFWLKGVAAACFVLLGAILATQGHHSAYGRLVLVGLILGLCGDELLALRFLVPKLHDAFFALGAATFAVGHLFYIKALYDLGVIRPVVLIPVFLVGVAVANLYGKHQGSHAGHLQIPAVAYMVLVIFMGAVSIAAFAGAPGLGLLLFAIGGISFGCSDSILLANCFGKNQNWSKNVWIHVTYYGAQLLIAWSIFFLTM